MKTMLRSSIILSVLAVLVMLATLALATPASAQEVTRMPDGARQSLGAEAGLESAFIARATYGHRVDLGFVPEARLFVRFTMPVVTPDLGDWAIDGGIQATAIAWGDLRLAVAVGPVVRNSVNEVFSATATGVSGTILFGYQGARWGLSAEAGYEQIVATYLRHSDRYRDTGYADAKDGFYALTGSTAHAGLRGGARFGAVEIFTRAGIDATGHFHALTPPFYVTLGGAYAF
jgi:hypothetical protein